MVSVALLPGEQSDHGECAQGHDEVSHEIEHHGIRAQGAADFEGHKQIAHVRNGGVCQDSLHIVFEEREQVAREHRRDGDNREHEKQGCELAHPRLGEIPQQQCEHAPFGNSGNEGGHRRGRSPIDIWRPHVERHKGQFEADAGNDHRRAGQEQSKIQVCTDSQKMGHLAEVHCPEIGINQGDPKDEEC